MHIRNGFPCRFKTLCRSRVECFPRVRDFKICASGIPLFGDFFLDFLWSSEARGGRPRSSLPSVIVVANSCYWVLDISFLSIPWWMLPVSRVSRSPVGSLVVCVVAATMSRPNPYRRVFRVATLRLWTILPEERGILL